MTRAALGLAALLVLPWPLLAAGPSAQDDVAFHFGYATVVDVLANDSEPDGEVLTLSIASPGDCSGALTIDGHLIRYEPLPGRAEDLCTATYRVTDESGASATASLTLRYPFDVEIFADDFESGDLSRWSYVEG